MSVRDLAVRPFTAGVAAVSLMLGTVVVQAEHEKSDDTNYNPMAEMNTAGDSSTSSITGMSMSPDTTASPPAGGTMTIADASMPMSMADPKPAAAMPGGLHSTCKAKVCTVAFAPTATGVAKILGTTAKLDSARTKQVVLTVRNKRLTLHQGKPVIDGKLRIELTNATAHEYIVKFSESR